MWISTGTATPQHNLRTIQLPSIRHYNTALLYLCFVFSQFCYSITLPLFCFQSLLLQHYLTSVLFSITSVTALPHLCFVVNHFCCSIASPLFCFQSVLLQHYLTSVLLSITSVTALPHLCFVVSQFCSHVLHVYRASSTSSLLIRLTLAGRTATSIGSVPKRLNDIHAYYKSSSGMGMSDCFVLPACHSVCVSCRN